MKIHDEFDEWSAGALCGALTPEEQKNFEQHLAECPRCRSLHEEDRKMNNIMKQSVVDMRPDPNFERRVIDGFREKIAQGWFHPWRGLVWFVQFRPVQAALAILILAAMIKGGSVISGEQFPVASMHKKGAGLLSSATVTTKSGERGEVALGVSSSGTLDLGASNETIGSLSSNATAVAHNAQVFSGKASWEEGNEAYRGNWSTGANWGDTGGPGVSGTSVLGDTATFDHRWEPSQHLRNSGLAFGAASSGTLQLGNGTTGHDGTIFNNSNVVDSGALVYDRFGRASYGGSIGGTGAVIKEGRGTETLTGSNTYTGATTVNGGGLAVSGTSSLASSNTLSTLFTDNTTTVNTGTVKLAVNNGSGTFAGTVTNQPGNVTFRPVAGYSQIGGKLGGSGVNVDVSGQSVTYNAGRIINQSESKAGGAKNLVDSHGIAATEGNTPGTVNGSTADDLNFDYSTGTGNIGNVQYSGGVTKTSTAKKPATQDKTKLVLAQNSPAQKPAHPMQEALAQQAQPAPGATPAPAVDTRKLIRNASLDFEVASFEKALDVITSVAGEEQGYVFSQNSAKGANGKLQGQVIVKVLPGNLDRFLLKLRLLGDMKNQTVSAQDVSKDYYDTEARIRNSQVTEQRLIDMMKTRTGKVSDLLEVENEISRVRGEIEQMQGQLKVYDAQVQFATVAITLQEKDLNQTAAYLLQEHAQLSLFAKDVEKAFTEAKGDAEAAKAQTLDSHMERDEAGHVVATLHLLIPPGASDETIGKLKAIGRIEHFNSQTQSIARNGSDNSDTAKVDRDKVELNLVIQHDAENAVQGTNISVQTDKVEDKTNQIKQAAAAAGVEVKGAEFNRAQNGMEVSAMLLRMPVKKYPAFLEQIKSLGKVKGFTVARREDATATEDAPAEIYLQIYSQPGIVSDNTGLWVTVRHTIGEGLSALMWSLRMIGVSLAFIAPWVIIGGLAWFLVVRRRRRLAQK